VQIDSVYLSPANPQADLTSSLFDVNPIIDLTRAAGAITYSTDIRYCRRHPKVRIGMRRLITSILLIGGLCATANADIWKWVDEDGNIHFGDTPAREHTANAELVTYTHENRSASTSRSARTNAGDSRDSHSEETASEERERQDAQAYYCNRAKEIYRSYADAPRLYKTKEDGQREYLSDQETAAALADAEAGVAEWCNN
jgi:hypothetical protein